MPRKNLTPSANALEAEISRNIADTLYQDRKIPQVRTAKALIAGLANNN